MSKSQTILRNLRAGAPSLACGGYMQQLEPLYLGALYVDLGYDRLMRKYTAVREIYEHSLENWNQTFYALLLRCMGTMNNRDTYEELSRKVTYDMILRERSSALSVEALLIGASGLLSAYPSDEYTNTLKKEYDYLANKYGITAMQPKQWCCGGVRPLNHPVLRLAQVAAFVTKKELVLNAVLECRTAGDVERLFAVEASEYWSTHFIPAEESDAKPKRIGRSKSELLGINLVAQLQFAYGSYIDSETLRERAISLLESIPPENNQYIRRWQEYGLKVRNAFQSQALLQLATQYCIAQRCAECAVGKRVLKSAEMTL